MSDHDETMSMSVRYDVVVGDLEERVHCCLLISCSICPCTHDIQAREQRCIGGNEKWSAPTSSLFGQFVLMTEQFVPDALDAQHSTGLSLSIYPVPKRRAEVEGVSADSLPE